MPLLVLLVALLAGVRPATLVAQDEAGLRDREPRFYAMATPARTPKRINVASTPVLAQRIAVDFDDVVLGEALDAIARLGHFELAYSTAMISSQRRVRLRAHEITVAGALSEALRDLGVDVLFSNPRKAVLVRRASGPELGAIAGRVADAETGASLAGVEVFLNGTEWRTTSDSVGRYRLVDVELGTYTMTARRVGYTKWSQSVTVRGEQDEVVDIVLKQAANQLDELVTTATGPQRRRDIGNAITTIRADSVMQTAPIRSLTDLLENRVPGLTTQRTSGAPGDPARLRLRGLGSINRSNDPVVIVDGIRLYAAQADPRSGNLTNSGLTASGHPVGGANNKMDMTALPAPSPIDQIDPNTIEKIEVFKGPSAATLYGADAANGVIVVTTKKGRPGPTRWTATYTHEMSAIPGRYPEGYFNFGRIPELGESMFLCPVIELRCDQDSIVRFQALNDPALTLFGRGYSNLFSLSASGGNQGLTYSLTASYENTVGLLQLPRMEIDLFRTRFNREAPDWMRKPHNLEKWSVSSQVGASVGRTLDVMFSTQLARFDQQRSSLEHQVAPMAGAYVDRTSGSYYFPSTQRGATAGSAGGLYYSLARDPDILGGYYTRTVASGMTFNTRMSATWRPLPWVLVTSQAGMNFNPRTDRRELPAGLTSPTDGGAYVRGEGRSLVSTFNFQSGIQRPLPWGFKFHFDVGANLTTTHTEDFSSSAYGLIPGTMTVVGAQAVDTKEQRANSSVFGWFAEPRIQGQRFSISTGIRLDGGSLYGTQVTNLIGLPRLNGAWVISEEPWFPFSRLFSSFRLRGAYGQSQVQPGIADRLRLYTQPSEGGGQWLYLRSVGNVDLKPERAVEFEGGFEADMLDSRLSIEFTGYVKNQVDALLSTQLPGSVGGGSVVTNVGNVRNRGIELAVNMTPVRSPSMIWSTEVTVARNSNILVKLGDGVDPNPQQGLVEGYPVYSRWARPIVGVADANGDGIIERGEVQLADDFAYMGRLLPAYTAAMFSNVSIFGSALTLSVGMDYTSGAMQVDQTARNNWVLARGLADPGASFFEQASALMLDVTDYGLTQSVSTFRVSSFAMNYAAPERVRRLVGASRMTISLRGSNLAMRSTYRGKDPNVMAWNAGENIVDTGQLPMPRKWELSVGLNY